MSSHVIRARGLRMAALACLAVPITMPPLAAETGPVFTDIASDPDRGLSYRRTRSTTFDLLLAIQQEPEVPFPDIAARPPMKPRGIPGVAVFDHDGDGDLDLYVTNGPETANSLFSSQLRESGALRFVDLGSSSGAALFDQDSTGVVFGDLDNDGDHDLYVLGRGEPNRLLENRGDGTFSDITALSGTGGGDRNPMSACLGDVDGDGLLDIFVANTYLTWENRVGVLLVPWALNDHNQLFRNLGGNVFEDVSVSAGITTLDWSGVPAPGVPAPPGAAGASLACGMVDYDLDGDIDILFGDDQGGMPGSAFGGTDRGFIHVMRNDGTGRFTDVMRAAGTQQIGGWMGFTFGDYNADGTLDFFSTNAGPFLFTVFNSPGDRLAFNSAWFLGHGDGTFTPPSVGGLVATPFGWGTSTLDFDNDGDQDIVFHGAHDSGPLIDKSNPGTLLENLGGANFVRRTGAFANVDHRRRGAHGVAVGDLDDDGFVDIVTTSNQDFQAGIPLLPFPQGFGSPFDEEAAFVPIFQPIGPGVFTFSGLPEPVDGSLTVELNNAATGNRWLKVDAVGMIGATPRGVVNRDAIGAVITVTPRRHGEASAPAMVPVAGGSSLASQDSLTADFGLGRARRASVDVLWPGGVRSRLHGARAGETVVFPELTCSFDDLSLSLRAFLDCTSQDLDDAVEAGVITQGARGRFLASAIVSFFEARF